MAMLQQHRVLIYTTCYNVLDGVTLTIRKLEQEILAAGHSVCILTTLSGDLANAHLDGQHPNRSLLYMDNSIPIPFVHDPNNPDLTYQVGFSLSRAIKRQLEDFEPTMVHITVPDCTALHLIEYARRKEIPIMGTYHSNIPEYMDHYPGLSWLKPILGGFFRHQYNFLQALYVPTPFIQRHLADVYQLDRLTSLGVWGRGVDVERFHPDHRLGSKFRVQLGLHNDEDDDVVLCWVGRLVPEKRVDIFCDTVRRMHAAGLQFRVIVVGAGPCEEEIKTLPNTTFCGWMNADQLAVAYASSDVFLFPSSVETFGNVTLEAMASGLPVVVEAGCSGHLVEEGVNGYACAAGDADAFYEATAELVRNKSRRMLYSHNSRIKAEQLEKRSVVRQMLQHYSTLTDEFYTEYGGHHANRDKRYSFVAGNHPRPMLLVMVEWLFIVLFQVLWNMSQMANAMLRRSRPLALPQEAPEAAVVSKSSPHQDQTSTPSNDDESSQASSADEDSEEETSKKSRCNVDVPNLMAVSFIRTMEFICRMESHFRNGVSSCRRTTVRGFRLKRKNSFDLTAATTSSSSSAIGAQKRKSGGEKITIELTRTQPSGIDSAEGGRPVVYKKTMRSRGGGGVGSLCATTDAMTVQPMSPKKSSSLTTTTTSPPVSANHHHHSATDALLPVV